MKRILITLFAIGMTAMSSMSMAAMSNSQVRQETRFLTDKMAYELRLNTTQYNDIYEINYDFIYSVRYLMDDVVRGYEWALNDYYAFLDVRNDDLRWVLSDMQYRTFLNLDYFYRPIYMNGPKWSFRIYINYPSRSLFYFGKPYHYRTYSGGHYRIHYNNVSYYRGRYNHTPYTAHYSVRDNRTYVSNRRSDFGSVSIRSNSSARPTARTSKSAPVPPGIHDGRNTNSNRATDHRTSTGSNGNHRSFHFENTSRDTKDNNAGSGNNSSGSNERSNVNRNSESRSNESRRKNNTGRSTESRKETTAPSRTSTTTPSETNGSRSGNTRTTTTRSTTTRSSDSGKSENVSRTGTRSSGSSSTRSNSESRSSSSSSRSSERSRGSRR